MVHLALFSLFIGIVFKDTLFPVKNENYIHDTISKKNILSHKEAYQYLVREKLSYCKTLIPKKIIFPAINAGEHVKRCTLCTQNITKLNGDMRKIDSSNLKSSETIISHINIYKELKKIPRIFKAT